MPTVTCHQCGKSFERQLNQINRARLQFCSRICKSNNPDFNKTASEKSGDAQRYKGECKTYVKFRGRHLHRVVAERKLGRPLIPGEVVHHIDGNKRNNEPANICVISQSEHIKIHFDELKAARTAKNGFARGERSGMAKLTESAVRQIKSDSSSGLKTQDIADRFNVSTSTIQRVLNGKGWRHVQ